jgi:hypothetical protein
MIAAWFTPIVSSKEDSLAGERSTQFPIADAQSIVDMVDVIPLIWSARDCHVCYP